MITRLQDLRKVSSASNPNESAAVEGVNLTVATHGAAAHRDTRRSEDAP